MDSTQLFADDFHYIAQSVDWPTARRNLFVPFNEHLVTTTRIITFVLVQIGGEHPSAVRGLHRRFVCVDVASSIPFGAAARTRGTPLAHRLRLVRSLRQLFRNHPLVFRESMDDLHLSVDRLASPGGSSLHVPSHRRNAILGTGALELLDWRCRRSAVFTLVVVFARTPKLDLAASRAGGRRLDDWRDDPR